MSLHKDQKSWSDPKKIAARQETIINQYRRLFGQSMPKDKQYWTMCGQCTTTDNEFQEGCELHQILEEGLITLDQFHGVDIDKEITSANQQAVPQASWYADDFYQAMLKACTESKFNPAIVNADTVNMPDRACGYVSDIMALLSDCVGEVMLVSNMILEYQRFPDRDRDAEFIIQKLNSLSSFQYALAVSDWQFDQVYYPYAGTGEESRTKMGSMIFYKR
jgi:hypothetical protein